MPIFWGLERQLVSLNNSNRTGLNIFISCQQIHFLLSLNANFGISPTIHH
jgi:hypothetical protein